MKGKRVKGKRVLPDLSIGQDALVVRIKFVAEEFTSQQASGVKRPAIESMKVMSQERAAGGDRMLVFFDAKKHFGLKDRKEIERAGPHVTALFCPENAPELLPDGSVRTPKG